MNSGKDLGILLLSILLLIPLVPVVPAQTPPPVNADWDISDVTLIKDQVIDLKWNLTVNGTGVLTFDNVTLIMNSTSNHQLTIKVQVGGEFHVSDSLITAENGLRHYNFDVFGKMVMNNTTVEEVSGDPLVRSGGIHIKNDTVVITNSTIRDCEVNGVQVNLSKPLIAYNEIYDNPRFGIASVGVSPQGPTIHGNDIHDNLVGISLNGNQGSTISSNHIYNNTITAIGVTSSADPTIFDNIIEGNGESGIHGMGSSNATIYNNTISNNSIVAMAFEASARAQIFDNQLSGAKFFGIKLTDSSRATIHNNSIYDNDLDGISVATFSEVRIFDNQIHDNLEVAVRIFNSASASIFNNNLSSNNGGLAIGSNIGPKVHNNTISDNSEGILIGNSAFPSIYDNIISNHSGAGISMIDTSHPDVYDNKIYGNGLNGIQVQDLSAPMINDNIILGNSIAGIIVIDYSSPVIRSNVIRGNLDGVVSWDSPAPTILGNSINNNSASGVRVTGASALVMSNNTIADNDENGAWVSLSEPASSVTMTDNLVEGNAYRGLYLALQGDVLITGNEIRNNDDDGIECRGGNLSLQNNIISRNGPVQLDLNSLSVNGSNNIITGELLPGSVAMSAKDTVVDLENDTYEWSETGLYMDRSDIKVRNSTFQYLDIDLEFIYDSTVKSINTTIDDDGIRFDKDDVGSIFRSLWFMDLEVIDRFDRPLSYATISIPYEDWNITLDASGRSDGLLMTSHTITKVDGRKDIAHTVQVSVTDPVEDSMAFGNLSVPTNLEKTLVFDFIPTIGEIGPVMLNEGETLVVDVKDIVTDPDNDFEDLNITVSSNHIQVQEGSLVLYYDNELTDGQELVTMNVSDGTRWTLTDFMVLVVPVNDPPTVRPIPLVNVTEDQPYVLDLSPYLQDEEGDQIFVEVLSSFVVVDGLNLTLTYPEGVLEETVTVFVYDGMSETEGEFLVNVIPVNDPPIIGAIPTVMATEDIGKKLDLGPYVSDLDDKMEDLVITLENDTYATLNGTVITFLYPDGVTEDHVLVKVSDGDLETTSVINITITPFNDPPVVLDIPEQRISAGEAFTLDLSLYISDEDTDLMDLIVRTKAKYVTVNGMSLTIHYPEAHPNALYTIRLTILDGDQSVTTDFKVKVTKTGALFYQDYLLYVYILVPLAVVLTIVGMFTYRHIRYGRYEVKDVFLVLADGRLITHHGSSLTVDKDMFSGMLTAVQHFVGETLSGTDAGNLEEFNYEGLKIAIHRSENTFLAVIVEGNVTSALRKRMGAVLESIEDRFHDKLKVWDGDRDGLLGIDDLLDGFVSDIRGEEEDMGSQEKENLTDRGSDTTESNGDGLN